MGLTTIKHKYHEPPRTAMEVFEMLPEGTLAEVINNVLYMSPAPSFEHQDLLTELVVEIRAFAKKNNLGKCVVAPVDVYLNSNNAVQPDIVFIAKENLGIVRNGKIKGVPDLVIEVLSGNKKHDLLVKKTLYEKSGVKEYFIANSSNKKVITYYFDGEKFQLQESKEGKIKSRLLKKTFSF
ncbi:MAG: Uma2 family endonuclease [Chitinophagaceae bacterium]